MKKSIIFLLIFCGLSLAASGQTENEFNKFWIGGNLGFNITTDDTDGDMVRRTTTYKISPEFGYNFSDRWALGVNAGYSYDRYVQNYYDTEYKETTKSFHLSLFTRFSFLQGSIGKLFLEGSLQGSLGKRENDRYDESYDTRFGALRVRPGVIININDHIALVGKYGLLGIQSQVIKNDDTNNHYFTYGLDLNMSQFQLGINITF